MPHAKLSLMLTQLNNLFFGLQTQTLRTNCFGQESILIFQGGVSVLQSGGCRYQMVSMVHP